MSSQIIKIVLGLSTLLLYQNKIYSEASIINDNTGVRKIELYDGVILKIPEYKNGTEKLLSFEIDTKEYKEAGKLFVLKFIL